MEMAPFQLTAALGKPLAYGVYLLIGLAFGAVLEQAGFANSRKLAAQFYLSEMTVLKVMFTAIVTAMVLIFLFSAAGLLDFNRLYVPTTYLWPGIVGGLIMGVGFIIGGFCPGTSLVAVASLKVDAWFFLLGTLGGILLFGETVPLFEGFWYSSDMGRVLLSDWLGLSPGVTVLAVVVMAVGAFWAAERAEQAFRSRAPALSIQVRTIRGGLRLAGAGSLVLLALVVMGMGYPTPAERWSWVEEEREDLLDTRQVMMTPGELISIATNHQLSLNLVDVRSEADFNRFHIRDSRRVDLDEIARGARTAEFMAEPPNTVTVLVSNDEAAAAQAWKYLSGEDVPNIYILAGGVNGWLDSFARDGGCEECIPPSAAGEASWTFSGPGSFTVEDELRWGFTAAFGDRMPIANPDHFADVEFEFAPVLQMEVRAAAAGGCG